MSGNIPEGPKHAKQHMLFLHSSPWQARGLLNEPLFSGHPEKGFPSREPSQKSPKNTIFYLNHPKIIV
jgi:hypothetical protein